MNSPLNTRFCELWMVYILNHNVCKQYLNVYFKYVDDITILFKKNSKMENIIHFLDLAIVI